MRSVVLALALVGAACSSSPKPGGDGGSGGAGGVADLAASGPPDLAPRSTNGIACGAIACTTMLQFCCSADSGRTGDCQQTQNPMCGTTSFYCDGPEDCPPADKECCAEAGIGQCRTPGYCANRAMTTQAYLMCHVTADCPQGLLCRSDPSGGPYSLCLP